MIGQILSQTPQTAIFMSQSNQWITCKVYPTLQWWINLDKFIWNYRLDLDQLIRSWRLLIWFSSSDESPSTTRSIVQSVWNTHSSGSDSVEWLSVADSPTMETSVRMFFVSSPQEIFLDNTLLVYFWMVPFIHHKLTVEEKHTGSFRSPLNRTTRKANKPPQRLLLTKQNQHFRNLKRNN